MAFVLLSLHKFIIPLRRDVEPSNDTMLILIFMSTRLVYVIFMSVRTKRIKYKELYFYLLFCMGVKLGLSH